MKRKYKFKGLKCAHCAGKIENKIKKIAGVVDANVSYLTQSLRIDMEEGADPDFILEKSRQIANKIEGGSEISEK